MGGSRNPTKHYQELTDGRVLGYCRDCLNIMNEIGCTIGTVDWRTGKATSWFGKAYSKQNIVVLNQELLKEEEGAIKNTILHELAHLAAPGCGHGAEWKRVCKKINAATGVVITRTNPIKDHAGVQSYWESKLKYEFVCPGCGAKLYFIKTTKFVREFDQVNAAGEPKWWCSRCRRTLGKKIAFKRLEVTRNAR